MRMIPPGAGSAPEFDGAADAPADPRGADTGCHTGLLVRDVAGCITMDERDLIGHAEFCSAEFRLLGEQLAHVDAGADDAVIACPRAQHLA